VEGFAGSVDLVGPIACIELVPWARVDSPVRVSNVGDHSAYRGGVQLGNRLALGVAADQHMRVDAVPSRDSLYRMLDAGRIDLMLDAELNGRTAIQALQLGDRVVCVGPAIHHEPTYLVVRRRVGGLATRLDRDLQAMKASGEWLRLLGDVNASLGIARDSGLSCLLPSAPGAGAAAPPARRRSRRRARRRNGPW
jgi:ABC-type amino acid transport substrate-binding protein